MPSDDASTPTLSRRSARPSRAARIASGSVLTFSSRTVWPSLSTTQRLAQGRRPIQRKVSSELSSVLTTTQVVAPGSGFGHQGAIPVHRFLRARFEEPSAVDLSLRSPGHFSIGQNFPQPVTKCDLDHRDCISFGRRTNRPSARGASAGGLAVNGTSDEDLKCRADADRP